MQKKELERYEEKLDRLFSRKTPASSEPGNNPDKEAQPDSLDGFIPAFDESGPNPVKFPPFLSRK